MFVRTKKNVRKMKRVNERFEFYILDGTLSDKN